MLCPILIRPNPAHFLLHEQSEVVKSGSVVEVQEGKHTNNPSELEEWSITIGVKTKVKTSNDKYNFILDVNAKTKMPR